MARWPITPQARAAREALTDDGICNPDSPPVLDPVDVASSDEPSAPAPRPDAVIAAGRAATRTAGQPARQP